MATEITNTYNSYVNSSTYIAKNDNQKVTCERNETVTNELSYLAEKYDDFCFVASDYTKGMRYGTDSTTNVAISPEFIKKMADDPALKKEYDSYFNDMRRLDAENISSHKARGRRIVAQGWAIDKNGDISRWGISEPTNKRHYGQEMNDYVKKLRSEKAEKVKEQEKRTANEELQANVEHKNMTISGSYLDIKL